MKQVLLLLSFVIVTALIVTSMANMNEQNDANTVLMVPPDGFAFNSQTADSNTYQKNIQLDDVKNRALAEYREMVSTLQKHGVDVIELKQKDNLPDAVFPNNWFSTALAKDGGTEIFLYPMLTPNRQAEVQPDNLRTALERAGVGIRHIHDLRGDAKGILEGTGSLVFDRQNKIVYAALSERTSEEMVNHVANILGYKPILFHAFNEVGKPIYHTNVMMGLSGNLAIVGLDTIKDEQERNAVLSSLQHSKRTIIQISQDQVNHMCGNVIGLSNDKGQKLLLMSQQAFEHFTDEQKNTIERKTHIIPVAINTIETVGGGSARCMVAEVFRT